MMVSEKVHQSRSERDCAALLSFCVPLNRGDS